MRIITGDLHLSHNPRDDYRFGFMKWLEKYARKRKPDQIVIAGDLTEEKDRHPAELVNKVVDHVHALAQIAPVIALEGNHDYKDEGHAFFAFLSRIPNTRWISKPTAIGDMLCLPHTNNYKRDWKHIDLAAYDTRLCHQTFNGASVGFGRKLEGIPLDVLPRNGVTLCGDIHVPQTMGKLIYIGAPYHVDFGDDFASRIIEQTKGDGRSIDTSTLPQKRAFTLEPVHARNALGKANPGDIVQITVEVETMDGWNKIHEQIEGEAAFLQLRVWSVKPKVMKQATRRRHKVADARSDRDVLAAFGRRHGLSTGIMKRGEKLL
jgi:DNA repair exonuclease SbcCD nuclease subunit